MQLQSDLKIGAKVTFPESKGERIYMLPFFQKEGLPIHLSRWQDTVDQMLSGIITSNPIYLMVDQSYVKKGQTQRRAGLHVEGNWDAISQMHPTPRHRHDIYDPELIILASDIQGCRAMVGNYNGLLGSEGQCTNIDVSSLASFVLKPNVTNIMTCTTIHESYPVLEDTFRTTVRLNIRNKEVREVGYGLPKQ